MTVISKGDCREFSFNMGAELQDTDRQRLLLIQPSQKVQVEISKKWSSVPMDSQGRPISIIGLCLFSDIFHQVSLSDMKEEIRI